MDIKPKLKISLITGAWDKDNTSAFDTSLKLVELLYPLANEISWVITNGKIDERRIPIGIKLIRLNMADIKEKPLIVRLFHHFIIQLKIMVNINRLMQCDLFIFAMGARSLFLPFFYITLILRKMIILRIDGRTSTNLFDSGHNRVLISVAEWIEWLMYSLAYRIAIAFKYASVRYSLQDYDHKICLLPLYIDTSIFNFQKPLSDRKYDMIIGYVGRLSEEKGSQNFVRSIRGISEVLMNAKFLIVGDGPLKDKTETYLIANNLYDDVKLTGWINHNKLPEYLNQLKLLVLPSYMEGLPNIMLEAMACGTPVLATPVGAIPDIIKDGETGFLMENNSPECIASNVIRALEHPDLEGVAERARALVEQEFTFEKAVEKWRVILEVVGDEAR